MPSTLSTTERAEKPIHTARHTSTLQRMPFAKMVAGASEAFEEATFTMVVPTAPPFIAPICEAHTRNTTTSEPARFPSHTIAQLRASWPEPIFFENSEHTISELPVKSSAPQQSTSTRPKQKQAPPPARCTAKGSDESLVNRQKNIAPKPMKAPASIAATNMRPAGIEPFEMPRVSAFASV